MKKNKIEKRIKEIQDLLIDIDESSEEHFELTFELDELYCELNPMVEMRESFDESSRHEHDYLN